METEDERFMARIGRDIPGARGPRFDLLNLLFAARKMEDQRERLDRFRAVWGLLFRLQRNEGPICRDLGPRKDMGNASIWIAASAAFDQLNAWSARKRTMVNPSGSTASSLFFTLSRKTYVTLAVHPSRLSSV